MKSKKLSVLPVSVSGGFWTGSGAVIDLLYEHPDCSIIPNEFTLFSHGQFFEEVLEVVRKNKKIENREHGTYN